MLTRRLMLFFISSSFVVLSMFLLAFAEVLLCNVCPILVCASSFLLLLSPDQPKAEGEKRPALASPFQVRARTHTHIDTY